LTVGALTGALTTFSLQTVARANMAPLPLEELQQLAAVFSMVKSDYVEPVDVTGAPGNWHFDRHDEADEISIHGRKVLKEWRKARDSDWNKLVATEYARTIASLLLARELGEEVENLTTS
jgi:hypothetical protein